MAPTPSGLRPILPKPVPAAAKPHGGQADPSLIQRNQGNGGAQRLPTSSNANMPSSREWPAAGNALPTAPSSVNLRKRKSPPTSSIGTRSNSKRLETTSKVSNMRSLPSTSASGPSKSSSNPRSAALDFSKIRTSAPAVMPPRSKNRLFGLEHCPVFYPTVDEFAKPLEYIERIATASRNLHYGICKIVPPEGWQPPFALDTETFRFKTRLQKLHSMEATARATLNFLEQLATFHTQYYKSDVSIPVLGARAVNLWQLRKEVAKLGGVTEVNENRSWPQVGKALGFDVKNDISAASQLRIAYSSIIQPFEEYRLRHDVQKGTPSSSNGMRATPSTGSTTAAKGKEREETPLNVTLDQVQAASDKLNDALKASPMPSSITGNIGPLAAGFVAAKPEDAEEWIPGEACEVCRSGEDEESILLCDDCDKGYHLHCLKPPLEAVPKGQWLCDACILGTGDDYGFEEGSEHTFASYHARASGFRQKWLKKHPPPPMPFDESDELEEDGEDWALEQEIEDHIEREFWRIISSKEKVEVEYGADLHTTKGGSAIPTSESHPFEPYARDGWNLNNLPVLEGSLLRHVKSNISGMTVPWGYVGMLFSTFAWHKEDHYTYSVNYQHVGGTKTWYGVPGEDDEKLEEAMKSAAPELFQQQPDLMWQLVTLMSPGKLKKAGVRVSVCDQRPNEFVITLPKAYHAGFNHDFNYNEAVNFCIPDWLPYDLECVQKYREINKAPVFSHDELLVNIFTKDSSEKASKYLLPLFEEMVERELSCRSQARLSIPDLQEVEEDVNAHPDEYYHCLIDKSYCFLSQLVTAGQEQVACVDHHTSLPSGRRVLKIRYSDNKLRGMLAIVKQRAGGEEDDKLASRPTNNSNAEPLVRSLGLPAPPAAPTITHFSMEQLAQSPSILAFNSPSISTATY